ncbi:MAG: hypothetical protein ACKV22_38035 [Bryobacteraceae bacterium]
MTAQDGRDGVRLNRRECLIVLFAAPAANEQTLLVRLDDNSLRVSAPQIRFLTGKPLAQLRDGQSVSFASQVTLYTESASQWLARVFDRFVVSFDLWEEKFSAVRVGPPRRAASRMTAPACETWCLGQMVSIPPSLDASRPFYVKMELRTEEGREAVGILGEPGINITRLIEIFSRPPKGPQLRWVASAGPLRLSDLKNL